MIIFGWGKGAKQLGTGFVETCENCGNTSPFVVAESSNYVSLYFIPVAKWHRQYCYVCPICSCGFNIPDRESAQRILAEALCASTAVVESAVTQRELA